MSRILVTGAAGFIGGAVVRHAGALGHEIHGVGHGKLTLYEQGDMGLSSWREDTLSGGALDRVSIVPDIVVHCAGGASVGASLDAPELDRQRTVGGTLALLDWMARAAPAARLVYLSSGAVYGEAASRPDCRGEKLTPISPYGRHKVEAEALVRECAAAGGSPAAIVRLFSVYGPGLRKQLLWDACRKMRSGCAVFSGTGRERRDWLEVSDAASLLLAAGDAASRKAPAIDGGTGVGIELSAVIETLAEMFDPAPSVRFLGTARPGDPETMIADPKLAFALGWRPRIPLRDGVRRYARWFQTAVE
jgi:UDP-glucose 4-epimerase